MSLSLPTSHRDVDVLRLQHNILDAYEPCTGPAEVALNAISPTLLGIGKQRGVTAGQLQIHCTVRQSNQEICASCLGSYAVFAQQGTPRQPGSSRLACLSLWKDESPALPALQ